MILPYAWPFAVHQLHEQTHTKHCVLFFCKFPPNCARCRKVAVISQWMSQSTHMYVNRYPGGRVASVHAVDDASKRRRRRECRSAHHVERSPTLTWSR